jgi:hypothetical protein
LVRRHRAGNVVSPSEPAAIASALEGAVRQFQAGTLLDWGGPIDIERFDRRRQAGEFARALALAQTPG